MNNELRHKDTNTNVLFLNALLSNFIEIAKK